jgi:hypothetical protein
MSQTCDKDYQGFKEASPLRIGFVTSRLWRLMCSRICASVKQQLLGLRCVGTLLELFHCENCHPHIRVFGCRRPWYCVITIGCFVGEGWCVIQLGPSYKVSPLGLFVFYHSPSASLPRLNTQDQFSLLLYIEGVWIFTLTHAYNCFLRSRFHSFRLC